MVDCDYEIGGELVFEMTTDPMAIVDTAADPVEIASVNSAFERRFGCEESNVRGADITAIIGAADRLHLNSRIQPGLEIETPITLEGWVGDSVLRVRSLETEQADARSLLAITDQPRDGHDAAPVGEDTAGSDRLGPVVEIARAEDVASLQEGTADLLLDGFGFDAAVVDLGDAEPVMTNVDAPVSVPRPGGDASELLEYDVVDDRNDEHWGLVVIEPVEDRGVIQVTARAAGTTGPRIREGMELVSEYVAAVLDRLDRERQLHDEYREIAIFDRMLRHEVMNGLNLVRARVSLLEPDVSGTNRVHYETATGRIEEMLDQIEAIRGVVTDDETVDIEAVSLADVVEGPVERATENHPEASFSIVGSVPDAAVAVDDLVYVCLRNVLRNAVQHAGVDDPAVRVTVDLTAGGAVIRIADNGPGISDDLDRSVFGESVSSRDDEGHGEGLFLTERIVGEIYDGDIRVDESDRGGAEFVIELPLADE